MNSDTPRTDAQQAACNIPLDSSACVSASFARELERENAALHAERDLYFNTLAGAMFSGKLDDLTCGELKAAYDKHKAELAALREDKASLRKALKPFAKFADAWDAHPIWNLDKSRLYSIHSGEIEGVFSLYDCYAARSALNKSP